MPSSSSARITRTAISPRLATRTLVNTARDGIRKVWRKFPERRPFPLACPAWGRGAQALGAGAPSPSENWPAGYMGPPCRPVLVSLLLRRLDVGVALVLLGLHVRVALVAVDELLRLLGRAAGGDGLRPGRLGRDGLGVGRRPGRGRGAGRRLGGRRLR